MQRPKQILGVSISYHLYQKLKAECSGKNVSAFVEKAIAKELEQKEQTRKNFREKLIKGYQERAKNKSLQKTLQTYGEMSWEDASSELDRREKRNDEK